MNKPNKKQLRLTTIVTLAFLLTFVMWMLVAGMLTSIGNEMHDPNDLDVDIQQDYHEQTDSYTIKARSYHGENIQLYAETDGEKISSKVGDLVKISGLSAGDSLHVVKHSSSDQNKIIKGLIIE